MNKIILIGGEGTAINIAEAIVDSINNHNYKAEFLGLANDNIELQEINAKHKMVSDRIIFFMNFVFKFIKTLENTINNIATIKFHRNI